jgi:hypothetical protein
MLFGNERIPVQGGWLSSVTYVLVHLTLIGRNRKVMWMKGQSD